MKTIVSLVLLLLATLAPNIEGASISTSTSASISTSTSVSYSTSISTSLAFSTSISHSGAPPNSVYNLMDRCPSTPPTLCLFYQGSFSSYQITLTNSSGGTFIYNTPYTQASLTSVDTGNFYVPGQTYMVEVRGVTNGVTTGSGAMLTITKPVATPSPPVQNNSTQFIHNLQCSMTATTSAMCTFSKGTMKFKRIKVLVTCYPNNNGAPVNYKQIIDGTSRPQPTSFTTTNLITSAECYIRAKASYKGEGKTRLRDIVYT